MEETHWRLANSHKHARGALVKSHEAARRGAPAPKRRFPQLIIHFTSFKYHDRFAGYFPYHALVKKMRET